jgi:hypothetical protein
MAGALIRRTKDELKRRIPNGRGFAATSNAVIIHDTGGFYPNAGACRVMMHSANHRLPPPFSGQYCTFSRHRRPKTRQICRRLDSLEDRTCPAKVETGFASGHPRRNPLSM